MRPASRVLDVTLEGTDSLTMVVLHADGALDPEGIDVSYIGGDAPRIVFAGTPGGAFRGSSEDSGRRRVREVYSNWLPYERELRRRESPCCDRHREYRSSRAEVLALGKAVVCLSWSGIGEEQAVDFAAGRSPALQLR